MSERTTSTGRVERRQFLSAVAVGLGGAGLSSHALARRPNDVRRYVVEQGDRCVPVTPLSGDETVAEFYDYRTPFTDPSGAAYSSYGTTDLQRPETSVLLLYDGPDGLSLVVVHDRLNDGTSGGAVTFRFDGLAGGEWLVGDDIYDGESNYDRFRETDDGWRVDWTWTGGRSDGGAYGPLGDDFAVTVRPAFNEDAALYGDPYEGAITDWQVLSGDRSDPDRISLSLSDPLTVRTGGCDGGRSSTATRETSADERETPKEETTEEEAEENEADEPLRPEVEVVPGRVNPRSRGRLPVVVRSSAEFDATALEPGSVELRPGPAAPGKRVRTDANGDGRPDLKLLFWMDATDIDWDTDSVTVTGRAEGREVVGTADVRLVPGGDDDDEDSDEEEEREDDDREDDANEEEEEREDENEDDEEKAQDDEGDEEDEDDDRKDEEEDDEAEREDDDEENERDDDRGNGRGRSEGPDRGNGRGGGGKNGKGRGRGNGTGRGRG